MVRPVHTKTLNKYEKRFTNPFGFGEKHCRAHDLIQAFDLPHEEHDKVAYLISSDQIYKLLLQNELLQADIVDYVNSNNTEDNQIDSWCDQNGDIHQNLINYFNNANATIRELDLSRQNETYYAEVCAGYEGNPIIMNTQITCKRWIDDQSKALAVETMYQVMLPCLGIFTVFTMLLYFFAQCMESDAVKHAGKKCSKLGSSFKESVRESAGIKKKEKCGSDDDSADEAVST